MRGENVALKMDCEQKLKGSSVGLRRKEKEIVGATQDVAVDG